MSALMRYKPRATVARCRQMTPRLPGQQASDEPTAKAVPGTREGGEHADRHGEQHDLADHRMYPPCASSVRSWDLAGAGIPFPWAQSWTQIERNWLN